MFSSGGYSLEVCLCYNGWPLIYLQMAILSEFSRWLTIKGHNVLRGILKKDRCLGGFGTEEWDVNIIKNIFIHEILKL